MSYYLCNFDQLLEESQRRGLSSGTHDELCESLKEDDEERGCLASTIRTKDIGLDLLGETVPHDTTAFGQPLCHNQLVGEKIIYWTLNTFSPAIQLFFESGLLCTIEASRLKDADVGLDPDLRFRLTDITYEEDGRVTKSIQSIKFSNKSAGIMVKEAVIAQRTSIIVKPATQATTPTPSTHTLRSEEHAVVGLRLEGMKSMGYIWAKISNSHNNQPATWSNVRISALRRDIPSPSLALPLDHVKPGGQIVLISKRSLISHALLQPQGDSPCNL